MIQVKDDATVVSDITEMRSHYSGQSYPPRVKREELYEDLGRVEEGRGDWHSSDDMGYSSQEQHSV